MLKRLLVGSFYISLVNVVDVFESILLSNKDWHHALESAQTAAATTDIGCAHILMPKKACRTCFVYARKLRRGICWCWSLAAVFAGY